MDLVNRNTERLSPAFLLFLFYIVVWWLQLGERFGDRFGGPIRLEALVAFVLLIVTTFDSFRKDSENKGGFGPFVLAFFVILLLQVVLAWNVERAWYTFFERVLKFSAMGLFISRFVRTPQQLRWLMFVWMFACWKGTLEGVIGGVTGSLVWENQGIPRLHGNGLWSHPNSFSQFAIGVIPFCFYLYPVVKRKWIKLAILSLFIFSTYVVIYTGSRTGYLGYLIMVVLFFFQSSKKLRTAILVVTLMMIPISVTFLPQNYKDRFMSSFSGQEKEGASKQARMKLYREGWFVFKKHPLGVGVGNYPVAGLKYFEYKQEQHCLYTEVLTELGIHGFVVFMFLIWKIYSVLQNTKVQLQNILSNVGVMGENNKSLFEDIKFVYAVVQATLVFYLLRLFLDIFGMDLYGITWWFVIGIASSVTYVSKKIVSMDVTIDR